MNEYESGNKNNQTERSKSKVDALRRKLGDAVNKLLGPSLDREMEAMINAQKVESAPFEGRYQLDYQEGRYDMRLTSVMDTAEISIHNLVPNREDQVRVSNISTGEGVLLTVIKAPTQADIRNGIEDPRYYRINTSTEGDLTAERMQTRNDLFVGSHTKTAKDPNALHAEAGSFVATLSEFMPGDALLDAAEDSDSQGPALVVQQALAAVDAYEKH